MDDWYFERNGERRGPLKENELAALLRSGDVPPETLVWTAAFGDQWKPASQTQLAPRPVGSPPPLPSQPFASPQPAIAGALPYAPPYAEPTDAYAYLLALSPLVLLVLDMALFANMGRLTQESGTPISGVVGFWTGIILAALDARNLYRSGRNPKPRTAVPFVLLTPIAYFIRRHVLVRRSLKFLWIWLGTAFVWLIGLAAMVEP